jgi:hypothetical protein
VHDLILFEDIGNGQTKLTFIGNEPMESAKNSGQNEGWIEILDKVAAVVAELAQTKWEVDFFDDRHARDTAEAGGEGLVRTVCSPLGRIVASPDNRRLTQLLTSGQITHRDSCLQQVAE